MQLPPPRVTGSPGAPRIQARAEPVRKVRRRRRQGWPAMSVPAAAAICSADDSAPTRPPLLLLLPAARAAWRPPGRSSVGISRPDIFERRPDPGYSKTACRCNLDMRPIPHAGATKRDAQAPGRAAAAQLESSPLPGWQRSRRYAVVAPATLQVVAFSSIRRLVRGFQRQVVQRWVRSLLSLRTHGYTEVNTAACCMRAFVANGFMLPATADILGVRQPILACCCRDIALGA